MLLTQDSIGHLQRLCLSVLSLSSGVESEWKRCSLSLSVGIPNMNPALLIIDAKDMMDIANAYSATQIFKTNHGKGSILISINLYPN